jgi:hypothetical protein
MEDEARTVTATATTEALTEAWLRTVTAGRHEAVADLFAADGVLWGTMSARVRRTRADIVQYFAWFAHLEGLEVASVVHHPAVVGGDVHLNHALVTWRWTGQPAPVEARMSFVFRGSQLVALHSSNVPAPAPPGLEGEEEEEEA